jgi:hypothetical protein
MKDILKKVIDNNIISGLIVAILCTISNIVYNKVFSVMKLEINIIIILSWILVLALIFLLKNFPILNKIRRCGLVDIEDRNHRKNALPPEKIYDLVEREYFMLSISAFRTFDHDRKHIENLLEKGIKVYVLILNPNSEKVVSIFAKNNGVDIKKQIEEVIDIIDNIKQKLPNNKKENLKLKFYDDMPTYLAVMIDGDIENNSPPNNNGQLRIQPFFKFTSNHNGLIVQLKKRKSEASIFKNFSDDLREYWKHAKSLDE